MREILLINLVLAFCPAGSYCTDAGCCPSGVPLSQCGGTVSLSVIPPPAQSASTSTSASTLTSTSASTSTVESSSSVSMPSSGSIQTPTASSNVSVTTAPPPTFTGGAAESRSVILQF